MYRSPRLKGVWGFSFQPTSPTQPRTDMRRPNPVHRSWWLGVFLALAQTPLPAQIGGYPGQYPPGQYPPGYPGGGGVGLPFPRRGKKSKKADQQEVQLQSTDGMLRKVASDEVVLEADDHRILNFKRTGKTKFVKEGEEVKPSTLLVGDHVTIEASEDDQGFMTAVNVLWQQDGTAEERRAAAEPVETSIAKPPDDEDRPVLRRSDSKKNAETPKDAGSKADLKKDTETAPAAPAPAPKQQPSSAKPAAKSQTAEAAPAPEDPNPADLNAPVKDQVPAVQIDSDDEGPPVLKRAGKTAQHKPVAPAPKSSTPEPTLSAKNEAPPAEAQPENESAGIQPTVTTATAPQRPEDLIIEQTREQSGSFLEGLPNYVCQEYMTRYVSQTHIVSWQPQDIVSTDLVYEDGRESYKNVSVNGKLTKKGIEDLPGAWSTGEFGTVLADVFSPATAADFRYRKESRSGGRLAYMFDFTVAREHSHWKVMVASQLISPSYRGSVWIDKETKRVLRIEMQATRIPEAFPSDKVESATDYEFVRFAEHQYLVPVHAETLMCQRGTDVCSRNTIDFRNYHKYSGESSITFK
ncbi:MAG: hypothetical protein U0Q18_15090 [Bryobacteraceae bacterium]